MNQPRPKIRVSKTPIDVLKSPVCERCGQGTRFVGLESDPANDAGDLCTYECVACQHMQVAKVPHINGNRHAQHAS